MTIEEQLKELRIRWTEANRKGDYKNMKIIECKVQLPPFNLKLKRK